MIRPPLLGETWLEITPVQQGVIVGCPGCGEQKLFERPEEPSLEHVGDCPVARMITNALRTFIDGGKQHIV
jgi:hypothetical protein